MILAALVQNPLTFLYQILFENQWQMLLELPGSIPARRFMKFCQILNNNQWKMVQTLYGIPSIFLYYILIKVQWKQSLVSFDVILHVSLLTPH